MTIYVQFSDETKTKIVCMFGSPQIKEEWANLGEVDDDDQRYLDFLNPQPPTHELQDAARSQRDALMVDVYDRGIMIAMRALRAALTDLEKEYISGKIAELDAYAEALLAIPQADGFPLQIVWPEIPIW